MNPMVPLLVEDQFGNPVGLSFVFNTPLLDLYMEVKEKTLTEAIDDFMLTESIASEGIEWVGYDMPRIGNTFAPPMYQYIQAMQEVGKSLVKSLHEREKSIDHLISM